MKKPVLSIEMIFKNDIRSIERCLKALEPLREAVPCELVMGDTGSTDGSRTVAERYADILIDFPWIDDFAAARNAVVDRCSGEWCISVDTDEYLDPDIAELTAFLKKPPKNINVGQVVVRNYNTYEMDGPFSDFYALRLVRLLPGVRFEGTIHESWNGMKNTTGIRLIKTVFHHDGYVASAAKNARNIPLLRKKLEEDPESLLTRLQIIESGEQEADYLEQIREALALMEKKPSGWQNLGAPTIRHAVIAAYKYKLPEFEQWADQAEEWFPKSYFIRIDSAAQRVLYAFEKKDYAGCIRRGEALLEAYADHRAGRGEMGDQAFSVLKCISPQYEWTIRMMLSNAYLEEDQPENAQAVLKGIEFGLLDDNQTENLVKTLCRLQSQLETAPLLPDIWTGICAPTPTEKRAESRKNIFLLFGSTVFTAAHREKEGKEGQRRAYTLFTPLAGKCGLGTAAAIMESEDPEEMAQLLDTVEKWDELPFPALSHAVMAGVEFPLPGKPMNMEELDSLADRLAGEPGALVSLLEKYTAEGFSGNWNTLSWVRALALAAVRNCQWKDAEKDMALARMFTEAEQAFITGCYAPEVLREGNLCVLPPMHRFGWHCVQAFGALDAGDPAGYVRLLREGLHSCERMKPMVEFLTEHTPELQPPPPSPELLALANQVRVLLARYDSNDPAVAALKASPAYQKVAYLLEAENIPAT